MSAGRPTRGAPDDQTSGSSIDAEMLDRWETSPHNPANQELDRGQARVARRFVSEHAGDFRYVARLGWHVWDGTRWQLEEEALTARAAISEVVRAMRHEAAEADEHTRRELNADADKASSGPGVAGALSLAEPALSVPIDKLDADPFLFNCANGTLDLRTGELRDHNRDDLLTKIAGCGIDPDAGAEIFEKFLYEVLPDQDVRDFVQRLAGYAMLGMVREHVLPIFTGTGANGKSTLIETLSEAFGDYALTTEPELLTEKRFAGHSTGQADLLGARLAITSETDEGRAIAASTVKRLTGGDSITARKMRQDHFTFTPSHTVVMVTNHLPKVAGDDPALWRRIHVVPFDVVIPEENRDARLRDKLRMELPAVLAWCREGYRMYERDGLNAPVAVTERTTAYQVGSDALQRFVGDRCLTGSAFHVRSRELYAAWSAWCSEAGEEPVTEVKFAEAMARHGFSKSRSSAGQVYRGVGLASDE